MRLAKKYSVPQELALLYEFLNSADQRTYVEQGERHVPSDELEIPAYLETWMRERGLLNKGEAIAPADHRRAIELRSALRSYLELAGDSRTASRKHAEFLNRISQSFPLVVKINQLGMPRLEPGQGASGLGRILAELLSLAEKGRLDRLKMCSSDVCHWIFFDRSKPGNRRWCSSSICGNRQKTRDYRERQKADLA
jgi:predicted RNA-binding Zn ribbon-like protein